MRLVHLCLISTLALPLGATFAAEPTGDKEAADSTLQPDASESKRDPEPRPAVPDATFVPSETIEADSSVAFPVDI